MGTTLVHAQYGLYHAVKIVWIDSRCIQPESIVSRGTPESDYALRHPPFYALNEYLLKEARKSHARDFDFPLTKELRGVLEGVVAATARLEREKGRMIPWLFHRAGEPIRSYRRSWKTACRLAGLRAYPHDFRRTAVRNLERAGVSRSAAMAMVGHRTQSIYQRYAIADETALREGLQNWIVLRRCLR